MKLSSFGKVIIILVVAFLLIIGGGVAVLYFMFPPQKIAALIVPPVEKALGRKVALEKAGLSLFPGLGFSLSGLKIENTGREGFSREPFVSVDRFTANIALASIFKGYPEITAILISRPQIRVEVDKKGAFNFDDLAATANDTAVKQPAKQGMPALPVPVTLEKFLIENGTIIYDDAKGKTQVVIGNVNQEWGVSIDKALRNIVTSGKLVLTDVSVKTKEIKKPLKNLTITLSHDIAADLTDAGGTVTIKEVRLSLQKLYLTLKGSVNKALTPSPELDLAITSDPFAVNDLVKEVPVELAPMVARLTATGTGKIGLLLKGAVAQGKSLPVQGTVALNGVTLRFAGLPQSITNVNADISFTENSAAVKALTMNLGSSPIDFRGTVDNFQKPVVDVALKADLKLGDLKDVMALPPESSLQGSVAADITAKGEIDPANPAKLDLKGLVNFKDVVMVWVPLLKPAKINGGFTLSSKAVAQKLQVTIGESSLSMAATITNYLSFAFPDSVKKRVRPNLDFTLTSPMLNIDEAIKPPDAAKEGQAAGQTKDAPLLAPLPGLDMKGTVTAQKFIYKGFTLSPMVIRVAVVNDIADVNFSSGFCGGTITNSIRADCKDVSALGFTNNLSVKSVEINDLVGRFGGYLKPVTPLNRELAMINKSLFGRINLQSSLSGKGGTADAIMKSIVGQVGVQMANGKIVNTPIQKAAQNSFTMFFKTDKMGSIDIINFHDLAAAVHLSDGKAVFDNLKIRSDVGDWDAKGAVGFDALMNMAVSTRLSEANSGRIIAAESAMKGLAKQVFKGSQFGGLAGLVDNMSLIPRDNAGRITVKFGLGGPVSSPSISSLAFGEGTAGQSPAAKQQETPKQQVQQALEQKKEAVVRQVEQKKEEVKEEVKKAEEQVKQQAKERLKGFLR